MTPALLIFLPALHPPWHSTVLLGTGTGSPSLAQTFLNTVSYGFALCLLLFVSTETVLTLASIAQCCVTVMVLAILIHPTVILTQVT
jgi:hypothetical protein